MRQTTLRSAVGAWVLTAAACLVSAQDQDADGLPDGLEETLGTNSAVAEKLEVVAEGKRYAPTAQRPARYNIVRVRFGGLGSAAS